MKTLGSVVCAVFLLASIRSLHAAAPSLEVFALSADEQLSLRVYGTDGQDYALEVSTNLTLWAPVLSFNTTNQSAILRHSVAGDTDAMFFRVREAAAIASLAIVPSGDTNYSITTMITPQGGSVALPAPDGKRIVLTIAPHAVSQPQDLTVTVLTNVGGLPFAAGTFGAVRIEPEQLRFSGSLEIYYPDGLDRRRVVSYRADNDGSNFQLTIDRARSNRVVIPISRGGVYGSSAATSGEIAVAAAYQPIYQEPVAAQAAEAGRLSAAVSRGRACWGDTLERENFLQSTKDCFEDRIMAALVIRCQIERAMDPYQAEFLEILLAQRQEQLLGTLDDADNVLGQIDRIVCRWYNENVHPHWANAKESCALTFVLLDIAVNVNRQLQFLGATASECLPTMQLLATISCDSVEICLKDIEDCCRQGKSGAGRIAEMIALARQFELMGIVCFDPFGDEAKAARDACLTNTWAGTIKVTYIQDYLTNYTSADGRSQVTDQQKMTWFFESTVFKSEEVTLPGIGFTNITMQVPGTFAVEEHDKFENWQKQPCPEGGEINTYWAHTENAEGRTNGTFSVYIQAQASGYSINMGMLPPSLITTVRIRQARVTPSCFDDETARIEEEARREQRHYSAPGMFVPYQGRQTKPDVIQGHTEFPAGDEPEHGNFRFEWNFVRTRKSGP